MAPLTPSEQTADALCMGRLVCCMKYVMWSMKYAHHLRFTLTQQIAGVLGYGQACVLCEEVI